MLAFWLYQIFLHFTLEAPRNGGDYTEGIIGQPMYVNPLLSQANKADADLTQLIFGGLMKYDTQGNQVKNLARDYEISEDKRTYTFYLREDAKWHDGEPLTASDVYFTFNILKDPQYKSPLRLNWQGVEIEQKDDYTVVFTLKNPYFGFLGNLTTGILPKHIWENVLPENFTLSEYNLKPIGSGPYRFIEMQKDSNDKIVSCALKSFASFHEGQPYISSFNINFYPDYELMLAAYNKKEIDGMGSIPLNLLEQIKLAKSTIIHEINIPRLFAVYMNENKNVALANQRVREALAYAVNRSQIVEQILHGRGVAIFSPILPSMKEYENDISKYDYDPDKAKAILDEAGWKMDEEDGVRKKGDQKLEFEILTLDSAEMAQTSDFIRDQWNAVGARVAVNVLSPADLQQNYIKPREYSALLFGQETSFSPDLYFFWHSSQKKDPGLNIGNFDDAKADEILEKAREESDETKRIEYYKEFQRIITADIPAIFLYSPKYIYPVNKGVKGIDARNINSPDWRFGDVNKWHIKTKRVGK